MIQGYTVNKYKMGLSPGVGTTAYLIFVCWLVGCFFESWLDVAGLKLYIATDDLELLISLPLLRQWIVMPCSKPQYRSLRSLNNPSKKQWKIGIGSPSSCPDRLHNALHLVCVFQWDALTEWPEPCVAVRIHLYTGRGCLYVCMYRWRKVQEVPATGCHAAGKHCHILKGKRNLTRRGENGGNHRPSGLTELQEGDFKSLNKLWTK